MMRIYASNSMISDQNEGSENRFKSKVVCNAANKVTSAINLLITVNWTTNKTTDFRNRIRLL